MEGLKIVWTLTAVNQRDNFFDYWNKRNLSTEYSKKLRTIIADRVLLLKQNPMLGRKTNFGETRILPFSHYSIVYRSDKTHLYILGIWDNKQDPKLLLQFLKNII